MKLKSLVIAATGLFISTVTFSQEKEKVDSLDMLHQRVTALEDGFQVSKNLKIGGYIQSQWQSSQLDSAFNKSNDMKVGTNRNAADPISNYNRFGVRRGRLKAVYEDNGCQGVIEFDISEGGLKTKDLYLNILDPMTKSISLKSGVFDRPFGYEIAYSSSKLESPERSRVIQTLFPDEKDLGAMLTFQAPKTSPWNVLKLEIAALSGNSINKDYKSTKDVAGHLTYSNSTADMKYGVGASMYKGAIIQNNANVYTMQNGGFALNNTASNANGFATRTYYGVDGQFSISTSLGLTQIRAEYIMGTQPGLSGSSASLNGYDPLTAPASPTSFDTYIRKFQGGYINFVQDILDTKSSIVVKYDWYDPNTDVSGTDVGAAVVSTVAAPMKATGKADMAYSTIGLGYLYRMNNNVRIMAYYDMVANEKVAVKNFYAVAPANLVTLRLQYKF
jgi:hypothetical protein